MKELQKYYIYHNRQSLIEEADEKYGTYYRVTEADAAFAEMRREHAEHIARIEASTIELQRSLEQKLQETKQALMREHAEEVERLKAGQRQIEMVRDWNDAHFKAIEKQAERYEKLRKLNPQQFLELWKTNLMGPRFDDLVDQLPANGEAQKQPKTLLDFGYAPGDYFSTCLTCNSQIQDVDKRCYCCKTCAQAKLDKWNGREAQK